MSVNSKMKAIADAIRNKTGKSDVLTLDQMPTEIAAIETGVELNFQVVGGTTTPTNPTENMIWVNTNTPITGYYFRAEQPGNMANGEVCIFTDTNGSVSFNALEKGNITIYPVYAKQMVSGSLVDVTAQIW
jgi:hypothetical protein